MNKNACFVGGSTKRDKWMKLNSANSDIISPGYPRNYPDGVTCYYIINAPVGMAVKLYPAFDGKFQPLSKYEKCTDNDFLDIHIPGSYANSYQVSCKSFTNVNPLTKSYSEQPEKGLLQPDNARSLAVV